MDTVDVVVIGGGPAGAAAATALARSGRDVLVADRATFPRDKCCGDGLTTGALRELERLGLDLGSVPSLERVTSACVRSPSGRTVRFPFPASGLFGAVARRSELDAAVLGLAAGAGATVLERHGFLGMTAVDGGVVVELAGTSPVRARYLIGADGMYSAVRKAVGLFEPSYLGEWHAFRQYVQTPAASSRDLWVLFERDLLPGYAWSFPLAGGVSNVGFGILRTPGTRTRSMAETWRDLLDRPSVRAVLGQGAEPEAPHKAWPIPARLARTRVTALGGRVLFAGDAARACDPMTGEGIGQALETGRIAAGAILAGGPHRPSVVAERYESTLRSGMMLDHRLAAALSRVMTTPAGARGAVRVAGTSDWTRRNFARWLFEDYPRAVVATPARWHAGVLAAAGPYR